MEKRMHSSGHLGACLSGGLSAWGTVCGGVSGYGDVCPGGCLSRGNVCPGGCTPPSCGQTDACENITFQQLLLSTVTIGPLVCKVMIT